MPFWSWFWTSSPYGIFLSQLLSRAFPRAVPDIIDTSFALAEQSAAGTSVGTPDSLGNGRGRLTWSILDGNDDGAFSIDDRTGEITVSDSSLLDYETTQTYALTVQVRRGPFFDTSTVTINLTDVNEQPSAGEAVQTSISENVDPFTAIATVAASDPDTLADIDADATNDTFNDLSYSITAGDPDGLFEIDANGNVSLAAGKILDHETAQQHVLEVTVTDGGGLTDTTTVTINVTDENEKPAAGNVIQTSVVETVDDTTILADVDGTDPDVLADTDTDATNDTFNDLAYSITDGNDDGLFEIDADTGEISLVSGESLDYETDPQHVLEVTVTDGGGQSDTTTVSLNVSQVTSYVIDFGQTDIDRLDLNAPLTFGNYEIETVVGDGWEISDSRTTTNGHLATFVNGEASSVGDYVEIKDTGDGLFVFESLEYATRRSSGSDDVVLVGYLNGEVKFQTPITASTPGDFGEASFVEVASSYNGLIDTLRIEVTGDTGSNAMFFDNIRLSSSPSSDLYATDGPDTFWFGLETGDVTIQDFLIGEDEVDLSAFGFSSTEDFTIESNGDGGSLVTLSETASINILGVSDTDLADSSESFVFV